MSSREVHCVLYSQCPLSEVPYINYQLFSRSKKKKHSQKRSPEAEFQRKNGRMEMGKPFTI